jgi:hypothetical protein
MHKHTHPAYSMSCGFSSLAQQATGNAVMAANRLSKGSEAGGLSLDVSCPFNCNQSAFYFHLLLL